MAQKALNKALNGVPSNNKEITWQSAIYARLSKEDLDSKKRSVSLSIEHQLDILRDYVKDKGWPTPKVFYDDDRTGTNFNRKGFQDMYAEAQAGNIDVIIIKDTSRFGRNWVQSGVYFERIEEMGIRFISIQEGLDTADPKCPALKMLPFYFIFNEWHSSTTSEKIRTVLSKQAEQGKYRASQTLYGYEKDPNDKYKLIIDPVAGEVVKRIFALRMQKLTYGAIARILNAEKIPCPSEYHAIKHNKENKRTNDTNWSGHLICRVLDNPVYRGDIARNKTQSKSFKNRTIIRNPIDEWVVTQNTHEALVSRDAWDACAAMRKNYNPRTRSLSDGTVAPLAGLLVCSDCGHKMTRNTTKQVLRTTGEVKRYAGYNCNVFSNKGKGACTSRHMSEKDLYAIIIDDINKQAELIIADEQAARERFSKIRSTTSNMHLKTDKANLKKVGKRLDEIERLLKMVFEKSVLGDVASDYFEGYIKQYEAEKRDLTHQSEKLSASIHQQSQVENDVDAFIALMKKHSNITTLDRETVVELIESITVFAEKPRKMLIRYNFVGGLDNNGQ